MKYVVLRHTLADGLVQDIPVIFPRELEHADVAAVMAVLLKGSGPNVVAAGECQLDAAPWCMGESLRLGVPSRRNADSRLIFMHDRDHGVVHDDQAQPQHR